jgi:amidase
MKTRKGWVPLHRMLLPACARCVDARPACLIASFSVRAVQPPSHNALREIAQRFGLELTDEELSQYRDLMLANFASFGRLDELVDDHPEVTYARTTGFRPTAADNELNAWYWRCSIKGAPDGKLAGRKIVIKDNVCVAGIPLMNGSRLLEGFVPDIDATVVSRILDAGGEIVGKSVCENLCFSGGSHTADTGPVRNPHDRNRSAGGSSSGSAVLVITGECDMAIGGDQGGSIRLPCAFSGAYGLKPTYGLVPYTGAFPIERTLDHLGPIAASVADVALLLDVIAGVDDFDPRQLNVRRDDYERALEDGIAGLRVGIVDEGFGWPASEGDVDDLVRSSAEQLRELGATVESVSVPWHREGVHVWAGINVEGAFALMIQGNGAGTNVKGLYNTPLLDAFHRGRLREPNRLSTTVKMMILLGDYLQSRYGGRYYAKAQNLAHSLNRAYDEALSRYDILVMPTSPMKATPLPDGKASITEVVTRALEMAPNTCQFNVTGHPAMNIPCGLSEGLPVGLMAIARHFGEAQLLRFARACEIAFDYAVRRPS